MKAVVITRPGGPEVLALKDLPQPLPRAGEVLIRVHAAGLNRSDLYSRKGSYGALRENEIPGLEIAGVVEAVGPTQATDAEMSPTPAAIRWRPGDRVCALIAGGGYAEYACVDARSCLPLPDGFSFEQAASLPETVFTVWFNVFRQAALQPGERFLVHGGSSGIGVTAIQMAAAYGARVYTTAGTEDKCRFCLKLGAMEAVNYREQDFEAVLGPDSIDVILDMVGGDYTPKNLRVLADKGRLIFINAMEGARTTINVADIMRKSLIVTGSMLKPQSPDVKAGLAMDIEKTVWPWIAQGKIQPVIDQTFPLEEAALAQQRMETGEHMGKIILTM